MEENIIEKVREFVEEEHGRPSAKYGREIYEFHILPMVNCSLELAEKGGGDLEIVELSVLLHDIGSVIHGRENHHITGAEIAERKLRELGYSEDKIKKVKSCILSHRGSQPINGESLEAKIISDADAISCFDNLSGSFKATLVYEGLTQGEAKVSVREKLQRKWSKLYLEESKKRVKPKYEAVMLLLK